MTIQQVRMHPFSASATFLGRAIPIGILALALGGDRAFALDDSSGTDPASSPLALPLLAKSPEAADLASDIERACVSPIDGVKCGGWKHYASPIDGYHWGCTAGPKKLDGDLVLSNTLAFFVGGTEHEVQKAKLTLNVNTPRRKLAAYEQLAKSSGRMVGQILESDLPSDVRSAIAEGRPGTWWLAGKRMTLTRDDKVKGAPVKSGHRMQFQIFLVEEVPKAPP